MVGFEQVGLRQLAGAAREWKGARFAPLYVAGVLAGAGLGLGLSFMLGGTETSEFRRTPVALEGAAPVISPPEFAEVGLPAQPATTPTWDAPNGLPAWLEVELQEALAPISPSAVLPAPVATEPAPAIADAAPVVPAAEPAAPPAPVLTAPQAAPQPAAPPAPAPEPEPAAPVAEAKPNFYIPQSVGGNSELEQRMLAATNAKRAEAGLAPYVYDAGLTQIARMRSQQMIDQGYFGHVDPYGYSMYWELLAHFGYSYAWAGENLAMNNFGLHESPERAVESLMRSPTHRDNILAGDFFRIGIGEVSSPDGRHFYTMIFLG